MPRQAINVSDALKAVDLNQPAPVINLAVFLID